MHGTSIDLETAVGLTRTGDLWLFRGHSAADRAIRVTTNSPVNHVGMAIVIDDLPALLWHAELGRSLPDLWSGTTHRGAQLHDLRDAVTVWNTRYGQRAWLRQLDRPVTRSMEDAALRAVARLDGTPFPSTTALAGRWVRGRAGRVRVPVEKLRAPVGKLPIGKWLGKLTRSGEKPGNPENSRSPESPKSPKSLESPGKPRKPEDSRAMDLSTAYCAEIVALTYQAMGLLPERRPNWYDPGRFWSGDTLRLSEGYHLSGEIAVA
jgi:hypothetical protein